MATNLSRPRSTQKWMALARSSKSSTTLVGIGKRAMKVKVPDPSSVLSALASNPNLTQSLQDEIDGHSDHAFKFKAQYCPIRGDKKE